MSVKWKIKGTDFFVAPPLSYGDFIFAVTLKGCLSKIDKITGETQFEIFLIEPVFNTPVRYKGTIFVVSVTGFMFSLTEDLIIMSKAVFISSSRKV